MKFLYCRVSTLDQKTDRQKVNSQDYADVIEDTCSGAVPFFDREGGMKIKKLIDKGVLTSLSVWTIDRLGRDLRDIMNTVYYFNQKKVCVHFVSQGLCTLDADGKANPISKMIISILGVIGEMERSQIRERQLEGIKIAKMKGVYKGRAEGSKEDTLRFLSKKKNKQALEFLKEGKKAVDIAQWTGLHINTITKIRKLGLPQRVNL